MSDVVFTRCARPAIGARSISTYTIFGFVGYGVAVAGATALALWFGLGLIDRLILLVAPPLAFLAVLGLASRLRGGEWIVFYQTACAAVAAVAAAGGVAGSDTARLLDLTVLGIGVFLVFGRIGCFHVACCHGRLARWGVTYGPAHVAVGFWPRLRDRTVFPIQLVESAGAAILVLVAACLLAVPGRAAVVYATGYAVLRFVLEGFRGDPVRPFALGLSEARWWSIAIGALVAVLWPAAWTIGPAAALVVAGGAVIATRRSRELTLPAHVHELDRLLAEVLADPARARRETRLGVAISCAPLGEDRLDWIFSSSHPRWSPATARALADQLWPVHEVVEGRTPGLVHVIAPRM